MSPSSPEELVPATASELVRMLVDNAQGPRRGILPVGGRTALPRGTQAVEDLVLLSTADLRRVIDYPARDMTITVEAGVRLDELDAVLAPERQRLALEAPNAHRATVGGAIAANASGPGRYSRGSLRDAVIGLSAVDGQGRLFTSGGRVVKNVAGYDLCKLLVGSWGTLAVISQVTLRLHPRPERRRLVWRPLQTPAQMAGALDAAAAWELRPSGLELLNARAAQQIAAEARLTLPAPSGVLCVIFEGSTRETDWQIARLTTLWGQESTLTPLGDADSDAVWRALIDFPSAGDDPLTFTAHVAPSRVADFVTRASALDVGLLARAGNGVLHGHLSDAVASLADVEQVVRALHALADASGGGIQIRDCDAAWRGPLMALQPTRPEAAWMHRLKKTFDPWNVLNPGRLEELVGAQSLTGLAAPAG